MRWLWTTEIDRFRHYDWGSKSDSFTYVCVSILDTTVISSILKNNEITKNSQKPTWLKKKKNLMTSKIQNIQPHTGNNKPPVPHID